jgi:hypothetical protein
MLYAQTSELASFRPFAISALTSQRAAILSRLQTGVTTKKKPILFFQSHFRRAAK